MRARRSADRRRRPHPALTPVAVAVASLLALLTLVGYTARSTQRAVQREVQDQLRSNRDAAIRALTQETERTKRTVAAWAARPEIEGALVRSTGPADIRLQAALRDLTQANLDAPVAFVSGPSGRAIAVYPPTPTAIGRDFSFRDWYRGVAARDAPYVSSAYRSAATGRPVVVAIAAPVRFRSRLVGYLVSTWQLTSVKAVAAGAARDDGVTVTITDQQGNPLTGDLVVDARGEPVPARPDAITRQLLSGGQVNRRVGDALVSARAVPGLGWTVRAARPSRSALASASGYRRDLALLAVLGILLITALGALASVLAVRRERERRHDEEEHLRLLTLFAASPVGILEAHPDGEILAANAAALDLLGWSEDELRQLRVQDLAAPESAADVAKGMAATIAGEVSAYAAERVYLGKGGVRIPVLASTVALRDESGEVRRVVGFVVDLQEAKRAERELGRLARTLAERETFLSTLIETLDIGVLACDAAGERTLTNQRAATLFGGGKEPPYLLRHLDGTVLRAHEHPLIKAARTGTDQEEELVVERRPGQRRHVLTSARPLRAPDGGTTGAVAAARDVTEIRTAEQALRLSEQRFRRVFDEGLTGKFLADRQGRILRANAALARQLGRPPTELQGRHVTDLPLETEVAAELAQRIADSASYRGEVLVEHAEGHTLCMVVVLTWLDEDGTPLLLGQLEDITARRAAESRLTDLALHDELTGLPNRRLLLDRCQTALAVAVDKRHTHTHHVGALFLDLDGFKPINDTGGHELGDRVLVDIATSLKAAVRPTDTVSRVGGDEFVVLIPEADDVDELRDLAERVRRAVHREVRVADRLLEVSTSVGVALADVGAEPDLTPEKLLRRADAAMYHAKDRGKNRHQVYDAELQASTEGRLELEAAVRAGLQDDRIDVVFQPVIDVDTGRLVGAETLMRMRDLTGRLLPTLASVRAAEGLGIITALTDRVLARALRTARLWPEDLMVAVNVSPRELHASTVRERVERALRESDFPPERLVLEITESSIVGAGESSLRDLDDLRRSGVRVAIDDFGTAYATLANLTTLPVDILKIDATFTAGLPRQQTHSAIVHGLASMAREMGIPCVVEGVETLVQYDALRGLGVYAQGWLWGDPTPELAMLQLRSIPLPRSAGG